MEADVFHVFKEKSLKICKVFLFNGIMLFFTYIPLKMVNSKKNPLLDR